MIKGFIQPSYKGNYALETSNVVLVEFDLIHRGGDILAAWQRATGKTVSFGSSPWQ